MTKREFLEFEIKTIKKGFKCMPDGIPLTCAIMRSTGKIEVYMTEPISPNVKNLFHAEMCKIFRQPNIVAVVYASESWAIESDSRIPTIRPSESPDRISVV